MKQSPIFRRYRWLILAVLVGWCGRLDLAAQAQEVANTNALTLDEAIRMALESSPELQASGAQVEASAGRAYQAKKWTNPQLQMNADEWPVTGGGRGFADSIQTIGIAQTLPYPGKKSLDKQIGGAGLKVSEAELALRRTEVVRDA